jgi:hypothetical protein
MGRLPTIPLIFHLISSNDRNRVVISTDRRNTLIF